MKLCSRLFVSLFLISTFGALVSAQTPPKREFRAAWIATVTNLDWPSSGLRGASPEAQRTQLVSILDGLKACGINAVIFQIRTECDALYPSNLEPWSYWLTGQQGVAPISPFDPLQSAIQEAHKRGMELHAWFNPYRAYRQTNKYQVAEKHVTKAHPEWIITCPNGFKMLNPGHPDARNFVLSVIGDVLHRYDVDGVHFDDYFYPYPEHGFSNEDAQTFASFSRGFTDVADWRRDNVNLLIKAVYDSILTLRPNAKFGISPFGIWKNSAAGTRGLEAYYSLYCDAVQWLNAKTVDYITPQIYWNIGYSIADYATLLPWWSSVLSARHLYPGQAAYRITDSNWGPSELPNQIRLNRANPSTQGSVFFRATYGVTNNPKGFADSLKNDLYKYPALRPIMSWKETIPPNPPTSLAVTEFTSSATISWSAPAPASDGGTAVQYVVYRSTFRPIDFDDPRNIVSIQNSTSYTEPALPAAGVTYYYAVTALDQLQNESSSSNIAGITSSGVVDVESAMPLPKEFVLHQNYPNPFNPSTAISYQLPAVSMVSLKIYDVLGREVATLVDGVRNAGSHAIQWNASGLPSGVYIYRIIAGDRVESKKMQLLK